MQARMLCGAGALLFASACTGPRSPGGTFASLHPARPAVDCAARSTAIDAVIADVNGRQKNIGLSVAIAAGDSIVYLRTLGFADLEDSTPVTLQTRFPIASVSKLITGLAALRLSERGAFDWDAPIQRYVPEFPSAPFAVTARLLAAQLAGIRHWGSERNADLFTRHFADVRDILPLFRANPYVADTAVGYSYSSYGYDLLALAMQVAARQGFQSIVREEVLTPLRLASTEFDDARRVIPHHARLYRYSDPDTRAESLEPIPVLERDYSHNLAGGNMISTAADLARLGAALRRPGYLRPSSWNTLYTRPRSGVFESPMSVGVFVARDSGVLRHIYMNGADPGTQAGLAVYPELALAVAIVTNTWGLGSASGELVGGDSTALPAKIVSRCRDAA